MTSKADTKPAFGGYTINFGEMKDVTLGEVFGTEPIANTEMTKLIWAYVKENELGSTAPKVPKTYVNLQEYWDDVEYEDMKLNEVLEILETMEIDAVAERKLIKGVFKLQTKKPDEFEDAIDNFVEIINDKKPSKKSKKPVPEPVEEDENEPVVYNTLQEYYEEVEYEDMKYNDFCAIMKKMGAKGQQFEAIKKIFINGYIKNAKKFVADIDEFVEDFMDGYKLTTKKTSKKSSK